MEHRLIIPAYIFISCKYTIPDADSTGYRTQEREKTNTRENTGHLSSQNYYYITRHIFFLTQYPDFCYASVFRSVMAQSGRKQTNNYVLATKKKCAEIYNPVKTIPVIIFSPELHGCCCCCCCCWTSRVQKAKNFRFSEKSEHHF